jgi:omega-6 fatty acid desaturase (delta-12 desaturase)
MWLSLQWSYGLTLALAFPTAGLAMRLFTIQHDCGHRAFFPGRSANDHIGRILGVLTLTPYENWRCAHARHHATTGNLDRRGVGDVTTLTVAEYLALSPTRRFRYRLHRHPLVLFGLGGLYLFVLRHRLPLGRRPPRRRDWISTQGTNLAIAVATTAKIIAVGAGPFLAIELPILALWTSVGIWMFYVEHQFQSTYWRPAGEWDFHEAALYGSSHLDLPRALAWCTGDNGIHHVHHLNSRIPSYRLRESLHQHPELALVSRIGLGDGLRAMRLKLWDGHRRELVGFDAIGRSSSPPRLIERATPRSGPGGP